MYKHPEKTIITYQVDLKARSNAPGCVNGLPCSWSWVPFLMKLFFLYWGVFSTCESRLMRHSHCCLSLKAALHLILTPGFWNHTYLHIKWFSFLFSRSWCLLILPSHALFLRGSVVNGIVRSNVSFKCMSAPSAM